MVNMVNMANLTGSFVSPSADATVSPQLFAPAGLVATVLDGFTIWKGLLTLLIAAVLYDQCKYHCDLCGFQIAS
jgi:C-22 sterol desaturase